MLEISRRKAALGAVAIVVIGVLIGGLAGVFSHIGDRSPATVSSSAPVRHLPAGSADAQQVGLTVANSMSRLDQAVYDRGYRPVDWTSYYSADEHATSYTTTWQMPHNANLARIVVQDGRLVEFQDEFQTNWCTVPGNLPLGQAITVGNAALNKAVQTAAPYNPAVPAGTITHGPLKGMKGVECYHEN